MDTATTIAGRAIAWNKGKLLGQKPPLKLKEIWAFRISAATGSSRPRIVGGVDWTRSGGLRHPFVAPHQTDADLPAEEESSGQT